MGVGGSNRREGRVPGQPRPRGSAAANGRTASKKKPSNGMAEKLAFTIKSDTAQDREAQRVSVEHQILTAARNHGFDGQPLFAIKLALDEALVNAIKHGNRGDLAKHVLVEVNVLPGRLEVFIEDEGPGFDRSSVPDPTAEENLEKCSGRGILLMESYMTSVEWDHGGRRVRLVKEK